MTDKKKNEILAKRIGDMACYIKSLTDHHQAYASQGQPNPSHVEPAVKAARRLFENLQELHKVAQCNQPTAQYPAVSAAMLADDDIPIITEVPNG